jgi:Cdc6-like AAA superfamily ATPase
MRRIAFGFDDERLQGGERAPVQWCEEHATNAHMLIAGKSGTGKTFTLRRIVSQLAKPVDGLPDVRVHVFDVHGDMRFPGESRVLFSESTYFGINPFEVSAHAHFGGVRKCVQAFIEMLNDSQPRSQLGVRQQAVLRNLLYELFEMRGFKVAEPMTWSEERSVLAGTRDRVYLDVPYDERDQAKAAARAEGVALSFDAEAKCWWTSDHVGQLQRWPLKSAGRVFPTVIDAQRFIHQRLKSLLTGGGTATIRMLEEHNRKVVAWQKKARKLAAGEMPSAEIEQIKEDVQAGAMDLIETFTAYVSNIETGRELEDLARYESTDMLKALADRFDGLASSGIFKAQAPPFDASRAVWSRDIAPLRDSEQQFFVWTSLKQILDRAIERGPVAGASEVREAIVLDEAHKFFSDKEDNILDKIAKEGRKFGIALLAASQAPGHFSEDFLGNVGTKVLLGLDAMYHDQTVRKMRIDGRILDYVVAGKIAAIQVSDKRDMNHRFIKTRVGA